MYAMALGHQQGVEVQTQFIEGDFRPGLYLPGLPENIV